MNNMFFLADYSLQDLTKEEQRELIIRLGNHDKEARRILIESNVKMVLQLIKSTDYGKVDPVELYEKGIMALIHAIDMFNTSIPESFTTYIYISISRALKNVYTSKHVRMLDYRVSIFDRDENTEENDIIESDIDLESDYIDLEEKQRLYSYISKLSLRQQNILKLYYGINNSKRYKQDEISCMLNISRQYVSIILKKTLRELKKMYDKDNKLKLVNRRINY